MTIPAGLIVAPGEVYGDVPAHIVTALQGDHPMREAYVFPEFVTRPGREPGHDTWFNARSARSWARRTMRAHAPLAWDLGQVLGYYSWNVYTDGERIVGVGDTTLHFHAVQTYHEDHDLGPWIKHWYRHPGRTCLRQRAYPVQPLQLPAGTTAVWICPDERGPHRHMTVATA